MVDYYVDEFVEQKESFIHAAFVIIPRDTSGPWLETSLTRTKNDFDIKMELDSKFT